MDMTTPDGTTSKINIGSLERAASVAGGLALALYGLRQGRSSGLLQTVIGGVLVGRGMSGNCPVYRALNLNTAADQGGEEDLAQRSTVPIHASITVNRPAQELYDLWHRLEDQPKFVVGLESVEILDETRSHWVARVWGGRTLEWDSEITADVPGSRLAWRALPGSDLPHRGSVEFHPATGGRGTVVAVEVEYAPPGGRLLTRVAELAGQGPRAIWQKSLARFKAWAETGEMPTVDGQPAGGAR